MDALAFEPQFLDHLAPIWRALPSRGRFIVNEPLMARAAALGVDAEPSDWLRLRATRQVPAKRADGPMALVASYGDIKVGRRLGYRRFAFVEHGIGQSYAGDRRAITSRHGSYAGGIDRDDVGLFLVPNEPCAARWRDAYPGARVEVVGSPRLEDLPARQLDPIRPGPVVAISFHWPAFVAPEAGNALGTFGRMLPGLARTFDVIGHAHPKADWPRRMTREYQRAGIPFVADFADVCRQADVYVCDNSSTLYEFASTGRPVVVMNDRSWRRDVSHGLRFWEAADVGIQVDEPLELGSAVDRALADPPEVRDRRESALELVYQPRRGGAAAAVTAITDWLDGQAEAAA